QYERGARPAIVVRVVMPVLVLMFVLAQFAPRPERNPTAKADQREARYQRHDRTESLRDNYARNPDDEADSERRERVTKSGPKCRARGLHPRPTALPRDQRDGHPMIGHECVQ